MEFYGHFFRDGPGVCCHCCVGVVYMSVHVRTHVSVYVMCESVNAWSVCVYLSVCMHDACARVTSQIILFYKYNIIDFSLSAKSSVRRPVLIMRTHTANNPVITRYQIYHNYRLKFRWFYLQFHI